MPREVLIDDSEAKEQVLPVSPKQEGVQEQAWNLEENRAWGRERETDRLGLVATCRIALLHVTGRQTDWEHRWLLWDGLFCDRTSPVPYKEYV